MYTGILNVKYYSVSLWVDKFSLVQLGHRRPLLGATRLMGSDLLDLPLGVKIHLKPKSKTVFCRGKLGETLNGPCPSFNLDDPYIHHPAPPVQYNRLHDPHLRDYHKRKDILRMLKRQGVITSDNKVALGVGLIKNSPLQAGLPQPWLQPPAAVRGQGCALLSLGAEAAPTSPWQVPLLPFSACPTLPVQPWLGGHQWPQHQDMGGGLGGSSPPAGRIFKGLSQAQPHPKAERRAVLLRTLSPPCTHSFPDSLSLWRVPSPLPRPEHSTDR
ncbi:PREDICTED: uncharacterized protein LOC101821751 [Ficedula albicollis]|uniref:uncharacterized protein LOC101821751 n=1 Tax=Ficedula albicollis TaxID=59894 RepID=UPI000359BD02|nr:PREDICTED: uncharacterized protein LOC101821751 [Ficedula albicollis]